MKEWMNQSVNKSIN